VFGGLEFVLSPFEVDDSISSHSPDEMKIPHSCWSFSVFYSTEKPKRSSKKDVYIVAI
jgi:hypothetical protein